MVVKMNLYFIVFVSYAFIFITSSVHGLRCYKCDSRSDADCTEFKVPYFNSVEICYNPYPDRTPMCRMSVHYKWLDNGEMEVTDVFRTGCMYASEGVKEDCEVTRFGPSLGATECWCKTALCNEFMPGGWRSLSVLRHS